MALLTFHWNIDPILFSIGPLEIRWYGLFFMIGLLLAIEFMPRYLSQCGQDPKHAASLSWWLPVGMILGAHLLHLVFYEPRSFIDNPRRIIEIGLGLASHGGAVGVALALLLYCKKHKLSFHAMIDPIMLSAVWLFPWVRIGNFFNSEIVGRPTDVPWAVVFERVDLLPRHPSQAYEAIAGFVLIGIAVVVNRTVREKWRAGATFYLLLGLYFVGRFLIEYVKEYQVMSDSFPLTMGQMLSAPVVLISAYMFLFSKTCGVLRNS